MLFHQLSLTLHPQNEKAVTPLSFRFARVHAQMAELVDALVSNTNEAIRAGSIPALGTSINANNLIIELLAFFFWQLLGDIVNPKRLCVTWDYLLLLS